MPASKSDLQNKERYSQQLLPYTTQDIRGNLQKKHSIFKEIIQIEVDLPPSHPIFDKFIFNKVLIMLTSLPPLELSKPNITQLNSKQL